MRPHFLKMQQVLACCLLTILLCFSIFGECFDKRTQIQDSSLDRESDSIPSSYDSTESESEVSNPFQPPEELEAIRINDTSVVLKWFMNPHAHDHLQFFKIQYKPTKKEGTWKTDNTEIERTLRAYQINGLRPGNYFFIVSAVYDNDDNKSSPQLKYQLKSRKNIQPDEMPEKTAPKIYFHESAPNYIRFKWNYQFKEKDMEHYGYLVYYRSAHAVTDFSIYNTLDENVELAELDPDTPYEAKVIAYNKVGVSDFSETLKIKTKPASNSTNLLPKPVTISSTTTTTETPLSTENPTDIEPTISEQVTVSNKSSTITETSSSVPYNLHTTSKPTIVPPTTEAKSQPNFFSSVKDTLFGKNEDITYIVKYSVIVLLPIILIVILTLRIMSCKSKRSESTQPTTHVSMQFDLEINGYFKNSFPGVEKEFSSIADQHTHHGFVNNHPHINDFT